MIFGLQHNRIYLSPIDLLGVAALSYLCSGIAYGFFTHGFVHAEALWSLLGCLSGWIFFSAKNSSSRFFCEIRLRRIVQQKLLLLAYFGLSCMLLFFLIGGVDYLGADKIKRSTSITDLFYLRIPFYMSICICFILTCETSSFYRISKSCLFWVSLLFGVLEMNRELIFMLGLIFVLKTYKDYSRLIIPSGFLGLIAVVSAMIFFLLALKPILYILVTGSTYDAGFQNFGEVVNWYRWLDYANRNNVDIGAVQANDVKYGLAALVLPYSPVDSASAIWFHEILGNTDDGRTFGYSGVLWLSFYFPGPWIILPWVLLFYVYTLRFSRNAVINLLIALALCAVSFRFFRSEWTLVLKTMLWTIIYPAVLGYLASCTVVSGESGYRRRV